MILEESPLAGNLSLPFPEVQGAWWHYKGHEVEVKGKKLMLFLLWINKSFGKRNIEKLTPVADDLDGTSVSIAMPGAQVDCA